MNHVEKIDAVYILLSKLLAEHRIELSDNIGNINYITEANLDSFELLSFISDVEIEFDIQFTADDLINSQYHTINGLAALILNKCEQ